MSWGNEAQHGDLRERPFFLDGRMTRKFAVEHLPAADVAPEDPIVVCHPPMEEKLRAHRVLVDFARKAAARGHPVLRFDQSGHGDSEGGYEEFGFLDHQADVREAWDWLRSRTGAMPVLVGLRLGAVLAARIGGEVGARSVLWEPVLDPGEWIMETLRAHLAFQLKHRGRVTENRKQLIQHLEDGKTVLVEGYGLTPAFYRETIASGRLEEPDFPGTCPSALVVSIRRTAVRMPGAVEEAALRWSGNCEVETAQVAEEPFWMDLKRYRTRSDRLVSLTLDWIEGRGAGEGGG